MAPPQIQWIWGGGSELLILLFALLLALLLYVQLWFLPLFLAAFIFLSSGTHNDLSFLGQKKL